jgi:tRNA dimethylallyltransferase
MVTPAGKQKAIAIVGTNASGKSAAAVSLAGESGGEIISADSRQVYRKLDIGTGKLTAAEMRGIPHHLLDLVDPGGRFSVADFQRLSYALIDDLSSRGKVPFIAGGTGLYVRAVVEGYELADAPPDFARREELEKLGTSELHELLRERDPEAAALIDSRNRRRIIRAVEMAERGAEYRTSHVNRPRYDFLQLGITWPREVLRQRIEQRLRTRLDDGMIDEVRALLACGVSLEWLDGIGLEYRFVGRYLQGGYASRDELFSELAVAIYRFAMRQLAWFRRDQSITWLDTSGDYLAQARQLIADFGVTEQIAPAVGARLTGEPPGA